MDELIERLEKQPRWMGMPPDWPTPQEAAAALRAAQEREKVLVEALEAIIESATDARASMGWAARTARAILAKHAILSQPATNRQEK